MLKKKIVHVNVNCSGSESTVKPNYLREEGRKRKREKKKKMAPLWHGGASHASLLPSGLDRTLLTSTTTAEQSVLGHHSGGDGDAKSEPTPTTCMFSLFSLSFLVDLNYVELTDVKKSTCER